MLIDGIFSQVRNYELFNSNEYYHDNLLDNLNGNTFFY
jgi:hypothetical protein